MPSAQDTTDTASSSLNSATRRANAPIVSVIVPVRNDSLGLGRCLAALSAQTLSMEHFEVLVVDNDSEPPMADVVAGFPFAEVLFEPKPGSYAARNAGLGQARGELIAFTDADCEPAPDWLEHAVARFRAEPELAALGGPIWLKVSPARRVSELFEKVFPPFDQHHFVTNLGFAATANLIMRRRTIDTAGSFDPSLVTGGDVELGRRLAAYGLALAYDPAAVVNHPARQTVSDLIGRHRRLAGGRAGNAEGARFTASQVRRRRWQNAKSLVLLASRPQAAGLNWNESLQVLALAAFLAAVRVTEHARVHLGGRIAR